ncbi:MAG: peptide ABC transporter substrate-binding protein [Simkania sp.]|nr:peptide ABC transporter substrate-binding protein [Simkania sp.]
MEAPHFLEFVHRHETLIINIARPNNGNNSPTMEPQRTSDLSAHIINNALYDCLTTCSSDGELLLSQAQSFQIQKQGKVYLFTLRKNYWSDGTPVTAKDFENTWKYLMRPEIECPNPHLHYIIKNARRAKAGKISTDRIGVKALDASTLRVELTKPIAYFLELVSSFAFAPLHESSIQGLYPSPKTTYYPLISNGPFRLNHWTPSVELVLDKNPHFYKAKEIALNRIRLNYLVNDLRIVDDFLSRNIDLLVKNFPILFKHKAIKHLIHHEELASGHLARTCCCLFNCKQFPFNNKKLRKAFNNAIDRPKILQRLTMMGEEAASGLLPPFYRPDYTPSSFSKFDLLKARALFKEALEEAEIPLEKLQKSLKLYYPHTEFYYNLAEDLVEGWQLIFDMKITAEPLSLKELGKKMTKRDYSMALLSWTPYYNHPRSLLERFLVKKNPKNYCHWNTKKFVQLLQQADLAKSTEESWEYCRQADDILIEEAPIASIFYARYGTLVQPYVKNFKISPLGVVNFDEIFFDQTMLVKRPFPEHPLVEELIQMLKQSIPDPLRKMNWYGVNFASPYEDYLCSLHRPDL